MLTISAISTTTIRRTLFALLHIGSALFNETSVVLLNCHNGRAPAPCENLPRTGLRALPFRKGPLQTLRQLVEGLEVWRRVAHKVQVLQSHCDAQAVEPVAPRILRGASTRHPPFVACAAARGLQGSVDSSQGWPSSRRGRFTRHRIRHQSAATCLLPRRCDQGSAPQMDSSTEAFIVHVVSRCPQRAGLHPLVCDDKAAEEQNRAACLVAR